MNQMKRVAVRSVWCQVCVESELVEIM